MLRRLQPPTRPPHSRDAGDGQLHVGVMAVLTAGTRVRVVNRHAPMADRTGEVIGWREVAFHIKLDLLGTYFFEPEELERVRD
jgi:hypothetical protein